jgi:hypothetical protein
MFISRWKGWIIVKFWSKIRRSTLRQRALHTREGSTASNCYHQSCICTIIWLHEQVNDTLHSFLTQHFEDITNITSTAADCWELVRAVHLVLQVARNKEQKPLDLSSTNMKRWGHGHILNIWVGNLRSFEEQVLPPLLVRIKAKSKTPVLVLNEIWEILEASRIGGYRFCLLGAGCRP